jgi:5'-nucleotidase
MHGYAAKDFSKPIYPSVDDWDFTVHNLHVNYVNCPCFSWLLTEGIMRPLILLTNDDGIHSPGLKAAVEAVAGLGDLLIVAPRYQQTAMARSLPVFPDVGKIEQFSMIYEGTEYPLYAVHGSPAQSVMHAILEITKRKPTLCVSGINYGENLGASVTISGTVGAALQAAAMGIPALAISTEVDISIHHSDTYGHHNWEVSAYFTHHLAQMMLSTELTPDVDMLNVNIPATATPETEIRPTVQSRQSYFISYTDGERDYSTGFRFAYRANVDYDLLEPTSDILAFIRDRVVTVSPLSLDLTSRVPLETWFKGLSESRREVK